MRLFIEKIDMIRQKENLKNQEIQLDFDWAIDFRNTDSEVFDFVCTIKSFTHFSMRFIFEGSVELQLCENFVKDEVSKIILDKASEMIFNMISITRDSSINLQNENILANNIFNELY